MAGILFRDGELSVRLMLDEPAEYDLMAAWLSDPRVLEYVYGRDNPWDAARVHGKYGSRARGEDRVVPCFIMWQSEPIGYLQYYPLITEDHKLPDIANAFGMDVFIGVPQLWEQGIGTRVMTEMVRYLFQHVGAVRVTIDPRLENARAVRCYEKAGFRKVKVLPGHEWHEGAWRDGVLMVVEKDGHRLVR